MGDIMEGFGVGIGAAAASRFYDAFVSKLSIRLQLVIGLLCLLVLLGILGVVLWDRPPAPIMHCPNESYCVSYGTHPDLIDD